MEKKKGHQWLKAEKHYPRPAGAPPPRELTPSGALPPLPHCPFVLGRAWDGFCCRHPRGLEAEEDLAGGWEGRGPDQVWSGSGAFSQNLEINLRAGHHLPTGLQARQLGIWRSWGLGVPAWGRWQVLSPHPSSSSGTIYSLGFSSLVCVLGPWSRSDLPGTQFFCLVNGIKMPANWPHRTG